MQQRWNAEDYARNSLAQLQWAQELIAKLALQDNESVLDIGCGDGKISAQLSQAVNNGTVVGIDQSEEMIALARETFSADKYPNLSFLCMDATEIHLCHRFDVAFSNATLHWVQDHLAVLRRLRDCLNYGGRILLQMGGRGNATDIFVALEMVIQSSRWAPYYEGFTMPYYFYGPEKYTAWLSASGFRTVRAELILKDMQHQGAEGLLGWLRTTWFPYTDRLPVELRNAFLSEVVAAYTDAHPVDAQGNTHVSMVRLEVEACAL
ncbi:MAG: methyltransferase domain-containing protein [Chlorobiaceae bacterium]|nr:methyltransferase domain-containing protein [Chlorobiaceae bacterium]